MRWVGRWEESMVGFWLEWTGFMFYFYDCGSWISTCWERGKTSKAKNISRKFKYSNNQNIFKKYCYIVPSFLDPLPIYLRDNQGMCLNTIWDSLDLTMETERCSEEVGIPMVSMVGCPVNWHCLWVVWMKKRINASIGWAKCLFGFPHKILQKNLN